MLLEGMFLPLTTPFSADGRLNLRKLEQNTARYSLTPAAGLIVLGAMGEPAHLADEETKQVLATTLESADSRKVLIAGVSRDSLRNTMHLVEYASLRGYDGILLHPPLTPHLNLQERRTYLQMVADQSPLPILLEGDIPQNLIQELAFHPRISGFLGTSENPKALESLRKETAAARQRITVTHLFAAVTRRMSSSQTSALVSAENLAASNPVTISSEPTLKTRDKIVSFQILTGKTESLLESLRAGATAAAPPFAAAASQATYEVMAAWKDGDPSLAEEKQQRLAKAIQLIERELGIAGIKYGSDLNGYFGGNPRLPLLPLTAKQRTEIERLMQGLGS